jgi:hypothetical protein
MLSGDLDQRLKTCLQVMSSKAERVFAAIRVAAFRPCLAIRSESQFQMGRSFSVKAPTTLLIITK